MQDTPSQEKKSLVWKLKKSLYGLSENLKSLGFKGSVADHCVFIRKKKELQVISVYVDNLILVTKT